MFIYEEVRDDYNVSCSQNLQKRTQKLEENQLLQVIYRQSIVAVHVYFQAVSYVKLCHSKT